jgi:hypothetical protein
MLEAVMVLSKGQFFVGLGNLQEEQSIDVSFQPVLGRLEELDGILNGFELPTAIYRNHGILDWIQTEVQFLNQFLIENDQLISIARAIEAGLLDVEHHAICHLMPHLRRVVRFKLTDFVAQLGELDLVLIEQSVHFCS